MRTAWEKLQSATLSLARSGSIKERITAAYRNHLAFVLEEDLPKESRAEFRELHLAISREPPMLRGEDSVRATIRKMSNQDADRIAEIVVRIFSAMPKSQPMLVRSSGSAQVIPLYLPDEGEADEAVEKESTPEPMTTRAHSAY